VNLHRSHRKGCLMHEQPSPWWGPTARNKHLNGNHIGQCRHKFPIRVSTSCSHQPLKERFIRTTTNLLWHITTCVSDFPRACITPSSRTQPDDMRHANATNPTEIVAAHDHVKGHYHMQSTHYTAPHITTPQSTTPHHTTCTVNVFA